MVRAPGDSGDPRGASCLPWSAGFPEGIVFAALATTGPDTTIDAPTALRAVRCAPGALESFDRELSAQSTSAEVEAAWRAFRHFLGSGPVVAESGADLAAWCAHLAGRRESLPAIAGLRELAQLLFPGRAPAGSVVRAALGDAAAGPLELRAALGRLCAHFASRSPAVHAAAARGYAGAWERLSAADPEAARQLALALRLVEHPRCWAGADAPPAGLLAGAARTLEEGPDPPEAWLAEASPQWVLARERDSAAPPLPPRIDAPAAFDERELALLDEIFEVHLPACFAGAGAAAASFYRESQHRVAREVASALGSDALLLVHAPTGTGKTLAYLIPALLWARKNGLRLGVATYTRALQEQALEREVPRALAAFDRAGLPGGFRIALLKGRENYLCWRAFGAVGPAPDEDAETWLAWTQLALFALNDPEGDLDRFREQPPVALRDAGRYRRTARRLVRQTRAQTACCKRRADRRTCAAEVARRRAERAHVVITNQSFALARQEFFAHVVFDECEHLHDQAHNAWSRVLGFDEARRVLAELYRPERGVRSRAPLDRLGRQLAEGTKSHASLSRCVLAWLGVQHELDDLEHAVSVFEAWRRGAARGRGEREQHSLLREYAASAEGAGLVAARAAVARAGNDLDAAVAEMAERLDQAPVRGAAGIRRALDLARSDLAELVSAVESWIPLEGGRPAFRPETFYGVDTARSGESRLAARVLLPNEYLGRFYYPRLASAVFLSATTWLRDSFDPALGYLGLDRAAEPLEEEEREPRTVRTFRAPEVFDYSRVLACVPHDAPSVTRDKAAFLDYVRVFLGWLGERTRGRILGLFTNASDVLQVGRELEGFFRARTIPFWYQGMEGVEKEELSERFRSRVDSILLGVDTFWFGADFPGDTLEYLVIVRLPYGVPDAYHHAQCAALGQSEQWRRIYQPRSLAKFRQGFGRLMRRTTDRGCVFVLDQRALDPRHAAFLRELPLDFALDPDRDAYEPSRAKLVHADTEHCLLQAFAHMGLEDELHARGFALDFGAEWGAARERQRWIPRPAGRSEPVRDREAP